jgi:hypothetical protein
LTADDTPTSKLIRQILDAGSEFDKAMVVAKLKGARERKRALTGHKVEGRKSHADGATYPPASSLADAIAGPYQHRGLRSPNGGAV